MDLPHHASGERDYIAMRTLTVVRQYLAAAFLLVIGLVAYGCGDSATVNPEATLANLTVTIGTDTATLNPEFNPATTSYTVDLSNNVTSATVSAQPAVSGDNVTIDGQATTSRVIDLGPPVPAGSTTLVSITVSDPPNTPRTYTVLLRRAPLDGNNSLQSLTVSSGTLTPAFNENTQDYTVDVANTVGSVNITPTLDDPNATMTVNGQATNSGQARTVNLNPAGNPTIIPIVVTAQNSNNKTYRITVSRGISSNNNLQNLAISPGALAPTFNANTLIYTVNVGNTVGSVSVTPTRQDATATITVNGQATNSRQARTVNLNPAGQATIIPIVVTAQNQSTKTYFVTVNRGISNNTNLQSLGISPGTLTPVFNANTLIYSVNVANAVGSVSVTPTRQDSSATITVNGQATNSGQARTVNLSPAGQATIIPIVVTAQNQSTKTYFVTVNRAALGGNNNLQSLTLSPGTLNPAFSANTLNYTVNVGSNVANVTVSATKADPNAVMSEDVTAAVGTATGQATITLGGPGTTTPVLINVTAPNGNSKTYRVNVVQAAQASNNNLSALSVTPGPLAPRFAQNTPSYTVNVASTVTSVNVSATKADTNAVMSGDVIAGTGVPTGQATISLAGPGTTRVVSITVTAPNASSKTYTITVESAAQASDNNLSAVSVTPGPLAPTFSQNTLSYTVNVANTVTSVNVSATKADPNAVMSGSVTAGTGAPTGQATIPLTGGGVSTPVSITVTAPNGSSKTYSITVNQAVAEPLAPTSAPDLIREDDSCSPPTPTDTGECATGTFKDDNVTNVTRPRFSIPQPGSGETAKLYINGNEVPSSFNSGDNTLRPNAPLPDGGYDITYTLSNSGGESDPSPVMVPQLQINTTPSGGV